MIPAPVLVLVLVLYQVLVSVSAASAPPAPGKVELQDGLLRWAPATDVPHTVQYQSFDQDQWTSLSLCQDTMTSICNVSALLQEAEHGCLRLRVRAQSGDAVEACSATKDRCTPQLGLSTSGYSLTVNLSRRHVFVAALGNHAKYNVCHWRLDGPSSVCSQTLDSLPLGDLEPGQTYCASAQFQYFGRAEGAPRCPVCRQLLPRPSPHTAAVLGPTLTVAALVLVCATTYILMFHKNKIKAWFRPGPKPDALMFPVGNADVCTLPEEDYSVITGFRQIPQESPEPERSQV